MREVRKAKFSFTKLIVDDEERMAAYYREVYGLHVVQRVRGESGATGESFREVIMGPDGQMSPDESLVMFKFTDRAAPRDQILPSVRAEWHVTAGAAAQEEQP